MRRKHGNEFTNGGFNEFKKQTGNILNHVQTFATFNALDNVLSGYGPRCDVSSVGAPLASCYSRITGLYLDVFRECSDFCGVKSQRECSTTFRGSSAFVRGEGDGLDKRKLQPSGNFDIFEAYLALCSSGVGSRRSRSLSQITPVFNYNLVHTDCSSVCGPSASLPGRSFHTNPNVVMITGMSNNGCSASRRVRNVQVRLRLNSVVGMRSTSRRTNRRVLTSGATVDNNSVASGGTSYAYSDLGDCDRRCRYCGASFWYVERLKGHLHNQAPEYHLCCGGGRIQMQPSREPPKYIKSLFQNKHFMENIRAYNQTLAMTYSRAKIDESINVGRGPMHHFGGIYNSQLKHGIVEGLIHFLDAHNELVQLFRTARDKCRELDVPEFKIRLYNDKGAKSYELPTLNTLSAMVFESGISDNANFDVIIQHRYGPPQRVNKLHPSYMSLQFPLLFIYGQSGYHTKLTLKSDNDGGRGKRVTMLAYYIYELHFRLQQYDLLFRGGRLFQQYVVGVLCAIEQNRLDYIRKNKMIFEATTYWGCMMQSLEGSEMFMKLEEELSFLCLSQAVRDTYVVWRVFEQKIQALIAFLKEERIFEDVTGEFQKRGLPYCHTLLWVDSASIIRIAEDVDRFISAELPDPRTDPERYNKTFFDENGHVHYRRRDTSISATRNEFQLDNSYVVSYNRHLLLEFRARINVEYCGWSQLVNRPPQQHLRDRAACQALGLLSDDKEWEIAFQEACGSVTPEELRFLFSHTLLYYDGYTLYEIEIILSNHGKSLHVFGLPPHPQDLLAQLANRLLMEERNYNREELTQLKDESLSLLNVDQRQIYDLIINADTNKRQELIFVYGHGGTGKTFLWKTFISSLRSKGKIVLAVVSSGTASLLLPSGHTAHSRFKLPLELMEVSLCRITKNTQLGKLLADINLIIWDEAPMNDRRCFEALDRSLRYIVDKPSSLFGGKSVLLGGDFCQTLPVKKRASKIEVISSCISETALWPSFKVFTLKHNMRLARPDISLEERSMVNSFASWLLDVGDGKIGEPADEDPKNTSWVHIPPAYCLPLGYR
uniref:ATP-dependent DNA helicase n=1 Tax=Tanacetum cinerariifolium TaxID=118510 RepID=A0A699GLZ2_TANCI|nr:DNA helicase [Tanacetum cinerariifolium]